MYSLVVVNQDASIYEFGQMINIPLTEHDGKIKLLFSCSAKEQMVSWHGYAGRAHTYEKWSFHNNFYRNRILLAVGKMLLYRKNFLAHKKHISVELMYGKNQILDFCSMPEVSIS